MGRGEAALEQQPHRVALVAERGLQADEDIAEVGAEHEDRAAVRLMPPRRRTPLHLDLGEMALLGDVVLGRDPDRDIGGRPEPRGIAAEDLFAQRIDAVGELKGVALGRASRGGVFQSERNTER